MKFKEKFSKKIWQKVGSINEEEILFSIHTLVRFPLTKIINPNTYFTIFTEKPHFFVHLSYSKT